MRREAQWLLTIPISDHALPHQHAGETDVWVREH